MDTSIRAKLKAQTEADLDVRRDALNRLAAAELEAYRSVLQERSHVSRAQFTKELRGPRR